MINEAQKKVIDSNDRFLFLLACAGSGKTRVIVEKIKRHLNEGVAPDQILAITFTRKSAEEMRLRIQNDQVHVHTFHSLAHHQLQTSCGIDYQIADEKSLPFNKDQLLQISLFKNGMGRVRKPWVYHRYQHHMKQHRLKDFDDLLIDYMTLPKTKRSTYTYVFIDEFQDTNPLQFEMLRTMIHPKIHVLAVGDPDQSIYRFRGSDETVIDTYLKTYGATLHTLTYNHRSTPVIIDLANRLIRHNHTKFKKTMVAYRKDQGYIKVLKHHDLKSEAESIIDHLKKAIRRGVKSHHVAIIYRNHHRANEIRFQLRKSHLRYTEGEPMIDAFQLMSIHQSKGLEFEMVMIIGMESGEIPTRHTKTSKAMFEERRLLFVGITRAKHTLYLSWVRHGDLNRYQKVSRFMKDCGF